MANVPSNSTQLDDVVEPEVYDMYSQMLTEEKSRLVQSRALVSSERLSQKLRGGGRTFNAPAFDDLANEPENIMTDDIDDVYGDPDATPPADLPYARSNNSNPRKITSINEIAVATRRHQSWGATYLSGALSNSDPMGAIMNLSSGYWMRRLQAMFIATWQGVLNDNDAAPVGSEHVQGDLTFDSGINTGDDYVKGISDFNGAGFIDATLTMSDSAPDLGLVLVHPIVYGTMQKNNFIDFIQDSINGQVISVPTYLGKQVVVDRGMPVETLANGHRKFDTWIFGEGATLLGATPHPESIESERRPRAGNGAGQDVLHTRVIWSVHPAGHAFIAPPGAGANGEGGPSNENVAGGLAHENSWQRAYSEREQIKFARYRTIES